MFYKAPRRKNIINVEEETFATLESIVTSDSTNHTWYKFRFRYKVPIYDIFKYNTFNVRLSVYSRTLSLRELVPRVNGRILTRQLLNRVQSQMLYARNLYNRQTDYLVARKFSDIGAFVDNEAILELRNGSKPENISAYRKKRLITKQVSEFQERGENKTILGGLAWRDISNVNQVTKDEFTSQFYSQKLMHDMIIKNGIDPSYIANMSHRTITSRQAVGGLIRKPRSQALSTDSDIDSQTKLLYSHIFSGGETINNSKEISNQSDKIQVLEEFPQTHFEIPIDVWLFSEKMRIGNDDNTNLTVKFDLINNDSMVIDEIVVPLELEKHIENYKIPNKPPELKLARSESLSKYNIEINARDKKIRKVRLFQKRIHRNLPKVNDYTIVGEYDLSYDIRSVKVPVVVPINDYTIYRAIPMGTSDQLGYEFTNIVVKPNMIYPIKAVSLVAKLEETGIELELRNIPTDVISIEFLVRDKTIFEKKWRSVSSPKVIDEPTRQINIMTITDGKVKHQHVYEYVVKLFYKAGNTEQAGYTIMEFLKPESGITTTEINNIDLSQEFEPNVAFQIKTNLLDNNFDILTNLLKSKEIDEYFTDAIKDERELFKKLVAHNVQRVTSTTGEREDFGILTDTTFDDNLYRESNAVKKIDIDCQYRYEVYPLLRSPETLFEKLIKTTSDQITKKSYDFSPAKFLHPITLNRGTIVSPAGRKALYAKQEMSFGAIGNVVSIDVQFDNQPITIDNIQITRIDYNTQRLEWQVAGLISKVDHFIIIKKCLGTKTILGKVHSEFSGNTAFFLHKLSLDDIGEFKYLIVPVFNDYTIGIEQESKMVEN